MAKKALIEQWKKGPKFKVRHHNRCKLCGRPHGYMRKFEICRSASVNSATKVLCRELRRQAGNVHQEGGTIQW